MSSIYYEFRLPYMRLWTLARKETISTFEDKRMNLEGRTLPSVIRQDECFCLPPLSKSFDCLAYLLALYLWCENCDYQMSLVINHFLNMARKFHYEGSWRIWFELAEFFELEVEEGGKSDLMKQRSRSSSGPNGQKIELTYSQRYSVQAYQREATIFSYMNFIEFLLEHFSEDDLFGNLYRRAKVLAHMIKIENHQHYQRRLEKRRVKRALRHRGYRDKGTLPDPSSAYLRDANRLPEREPEPKYNTLNQVIDWGSSE